MAFENTNTRKLRAYIRRWTKDLEIFKEATAILYKSKAHKAEYKRKLDTDLRYYCGMVDLAKKELNSRDKYWKTYAKRQSTTS